MKKVLNVFYLSLCILLAASTSIAAQNGITNDTDCDFEVRIHHGDINGCSVSGVIHVSVPANSSILLAIPTNERIMRAEGFPVNGVTCRFKVENVPCGTIPDFQFVQCNTGCGQYIAEVNNSGSGSLLRLFH